MLRGASIAVSAVFCAEVNHHIDDALISSFASSGKTKIRIGTRARAENFVGGSFIARDAGFPEGFRHLFLLWCNTNGIKLSIFFLQNDLKLN